MAVNDSNPLLMDELKAIPVKYAAWAIRQTRSYCRSLDYNFTQAALRPASKAEGGRDESLCCMEWVENEEKAGKRVCVVLAQVLTQQHVHLLLGTIITIWHVSNFPLW